MESMLRLRFPLLAILLTVSVAAALTAPSAEAAPSSSLRRYPYLTDLVSGHVTVNWATTTSISTGSVTYGKSGVESCTAHTVNAKKTTITVGSTTEYQWKAPLFNLSRNTAYCYRIQGGGTDLLGTDASPVFQTQLAAGSTATFSFAVLGDWGDQETTALNTDQANVLARIASSGARFAVTTGDVAYPAAHRPTTVTSSRRARTSARCSDRRTGRSPATRSRSSTSSGTTGSTRPA